MHLFRRLSYCCIFLALNVLSIGQQPLSHTLLWRISGKGLAMPSYLFGTMHLNDKRLFRFGDSVYGAIERTDGLAIEVNPDQMSAYLVNKLIDQLQSGKKLKEILDEGYFKKNSKALARKFGKPAGEINTNDVVREKNKWISDLMEKGEMATFVDAYLYNIARRQGKWVGGIEDIGDQTALLDDMVDRSDIDDLLASDSSIDALDSRRSMERMISLYSDQNLEGIENFTDEHSSAGEKDRMLINRNIKMARRIDSLIGVRTLFVAIGAAHLPGDSGVIGLLKGRGFTVTPVFSDRRVESKDYTFKEVHLPWIQAVDPDGNYSVYMPANPADVTLYGLVKMKFLLDLFNLSGYCTMAIMNSTGIENRDSLFEKISSNVFNTKHMPSKSIGKNGVPGKEYIGVKDGANVRVQIFIDKKMIYMAMISGVKKEPLISEDADKFFNSFAIIRKPEILRSVHRFTDSIMGVSLLSPIELAYNDKLSKTKLKSFKVTCLSGVDVSNGAYLMLISKETRAGYHIISDSLVYDDLYEQFKGQYTDYKKKEIDIQGHKGIVITGRNIESPNIYLYAVCMVRNNREIVLFTVCNQKDLNADWLKNVFSSFSFITQPHQEWRSYGTPDGSIVCWAPTPIRPFLATNGNLQWLSYDTITATTYHIVPDTLNKYSWYGSDSVYWEKKIKENIGNDRLLEQKDIVNGNLKGKELILAKTVNGNTLNRVRLLLDGDKTYKLLIAGEKELLFNNDANNFFDSFRPKGGRTESNGGRTENYITRSKASLILRDIADKDSLTRMEAYHALGSAPFRKADLPLLEEALFKDYLSPYDTIRSQIVNERLAEKVWKLHDTSVVEYIKKQYPSLQNRKAIIRNSALTVLANIHTKESYAVFSILVLQFPPEERMGFQCLSGLQDSLALTAGIYPSLQRLAKDTLYSPAIADLALQLMDSGFVRREIVLSAGDDFISAGRELLPALKASEDYEDGHMLYLIRLIGRLGTPSSFQLLKEYAAVKNKYLLKGSVLQLAKNDQYVRPEVCSRIASDIAIRQDFYEELKKMNKTVLFPAEYLTQARFAESALYGLAADDEDETPRITFLKKRTAFFKGNQYLFYLYKVEYNSDEDSTVYLGIAGGYDLAGLKLEPRKEISGLYWGKTFDAENIPALFKAYLKKKSDPDAE
jgi:uncharacterized protein YbaP (TraB family)